MNEDSNSLSIWAQREGINHTLSHKNIMCFSESSKILLFVSSQIKQKLARTEHLQNSLPFEVNPPKTH